MRSQEIKAIVSNNQSLLESNDSLVPSWSSCDVPVGMSQTDIEWGSTNQLTQLLAEYRDVSALAPEQLGITSLIQHEIETGDSTPSV